MAGFGRMEREKVVVPQGNEEKERRIETWKCKRVDREEWRRRTGRRSSECKGPIAQRRAGQLAREGRRGLGLRFGLRRGLKKPNQLRGRDECEEGGREGE